MAEPTEEILNGAIQAQIVAYIELTLTLSEAGVIKLGPLGARLRAAGERTDLELNEIARRILFGLSDAFADKPSEPKP